MFSLTNKNIVLISPNHWGKMHISKHHYAHALVNKGNRVFFISPPIIKSKFLTKKEIKPNLWVIQYNPIFRGKSFLPNFIFNLLIKIQIKLILKKIKVKPDIVWSFTSTIFFNLNWWKAQLNIFHPMDQLNSFSASKIADQAHIVFSCSEYILNEIKNKNVPKFLINHGLAPSYVNFNFKTNTSNNSVIQVGYIGNLFIENLDRFILKELIKKFSKVHFNFFGAYSPKESNISAWVSEESLEFVKFLKKSPNVTCHGAIPSEKLPEKIQNIDLFLICYKPSEENLITNSHKVLEYLSTGKTIVSSYIHHYKKLDLIEMCQIGNNKDYTKLFNNTINNLEELNNETLQSKRREYALSNSYSSHIDKISNYINQVQYEKT